MKLSNHKKHNILTYLILLTVALLSFAGAYYTQANDLVKFFVAAPAVSSLFYALFQIMRDEAAYEKQLDIQKKQFQFTLGATSHMASKVFDKHIEFCEEYMSEINKTVSDLYKEGEESVLDNGHNLYALRNKYENWLTDDINKNLDQFEKALIQLGANAKHKNKSLYSQRNLDEYTIGSIKITEDLLESIFGLGKPETIDILSRNDESQEQKIKNNIPETNLLVATKQKIRSILGIEELALLRTYLITEASKTTKNSI